MSESSILTEIKDGLGLDKEDDGFDVELTFLINSAISMIRQRGVGVDHTVNADSKWSDIFQDGSAELMGMVKEFVRLQTKIIFDPPAPSTLKVMEEVKSELIWRIHVGFEEVENVT